jgi:hypothetical protein
MISIRIFGTPVKIKTNILAVIAVLWGGVSWLGIYWHPERNFWQGLLIGLITAMLLLLADFGHAIAHIFSARYAGAPMDEIQISAESGPRTLYWNNEVSPDVHRMRAIGGPLFNLVGLILSLLIYAAVPGNSITWELAAWSATGHGLMLIMFLSPVSIVDGGTLLKWTLVARGKPVAEADKIVRRVNWAMGIAIGIIGVGLLVMQMWIAGVLLAGLGLVVMGIAAGKIH